MAVLVSGFELAQVNVAPLHPPAEEAKERLGRLQREGPLPHAFTLRKPVPPPEHATSEPVSRG